MSSTVLSATNPSAQISQTQKLSSGFRKYSHNNMDHPVQYEIVSIIPLQFLEASLCQTQDLNGEVLNRPPST